MGVIRDLFRPIWTACVRAVGWSLSPVEDDHMTNVIPMPGPAHGPVPAIELRRVERRKAS